MKSLVGRVVCFTRLSMDSSERVNGLGFNSVLPLNKRSEGEKKEKLYL